MLLHTFRLRAADFHYSASEEAAVLTLPEFLTSALLTDLDGKENVGH